jgi:hypothetical protein
MGSFLRRDSKMISRLNKKSGQDSVNSSFNERDYEHSCLLKIVYSHVDHISPLSWHWLVYLVLFHFDSILSNFGRADIKYYVTLPPIFF